MRALTYHGSHDVRVDTVPDPVLHEPDDILLKITATAICGSDLHLYRGKIPELKDGDIPGAKLKVSFALAEAKVNQKTEHAYVRLTTKVYRMGREYVAAHAGTTNPRPDRLLWTNVKHEPFRFRRLLRWRGFAVCTHTIDNRA